MYKLIPYIPLTALIASCSSITQSVETTPVSCKQFFADQVVSLPLNFNIPKQYVHAKGIEAPFTYSYWMRPEDVDRSRDTGSLPAKHGYLFGKLTLNVGYNQATKTFSLEEKFKTEYEENGFKVISYKKHHVGGYPVFSSILKSPEGKIASMTYIATLIDTNTLLVNYLPENNDLNKAKAINSGLVTELE